MFALPRSLKLLKHVVVRLRLASIGARLHRAFLACCALYAAFLLTSRLGGLWTEWALSPWLMLVPALALFFVLAWHRRPTLVDAARAVDQQNGTKDLFLTVALIEKSAGEYQALVAKAAEDKAAKLRAGAVVPYDWSRRVSRALAVALLICIGMWGLPQLDPFRQVEAARIVKDKRKDFEGAKKATENRTAQLQKDESEGPLSEETKKAIENLKTALNKMKPSGEVEQSQGARRPAKIPGRQMAKTEQRKAQGAVEPEPAGSAVRRDR